MYQQTVYIDYQSAVVLPTISTGPAGHNTAVHIFSIGVGTAS